MRKDTSIPTSITIQLCDDSIIIKDAKGKTKIASTDDEKRIVKIILDIVSDLDQPELDIHNIKITNEGASSASGTPLENLDLTDVEALKKIGLRYVVDLAAKKINNF